MTIRPWLEKDFPHLVEWLKDETEADRAFANRLALEQQVPHRFTVENGSGPVAMVGHAIWNGLPIAHILIKPESRGMKTWNEVYDLYISELKRGGFTAIGEMVPHDSRLIPALERKGHRKISVFMVKEI